MLIACRPDSEQVILPTGSCFVCDDAKVVIIQANTEKLNLDLYEGKEFVLGSSLPRDAERAGRHYTFHNISVDLWADTAILVQQSDQDDLTCKFSARETGRRAVNGERAYLSEYSTLIQVIRRDTLIDLRATRGGYSVLDTTLPQVRAASGVKYQSGDVLFWEKSNLAVFIHDGLMEGHCVRMYADELADTTCTASTARDGIVSFLHTKFRVEYDQIPGTSRLFAYDLFDLNNDNQFEYFVAMRGPYFCGLGGCTWFLLGSSFQEIARFAVSEFPIYAGGAGPSGYCDLYVRSGDDFHLLRYTAPGGYPANPSTQENANLFSDPQYTNANAVRILEFAYLKDCTF